MTQKLAPNLTAGSPRGSPVRNPLLILINASPDRAVYFQARLWMRP